MKDKEIVRLQAKIEKIEKEAEKHHGEKPAKAAPAKKTAAKPAAKRLLPRRLLPRKQQRQSLQKKRKIRIFRLLIMINPPRCIDLQ